MKLQLAELHKLEQRLQGIGNDYVNKPLYKTCPLAVFAKRMERIVEMYTNELATKRSLLEEDGWKHITRREEGLVWMSVWLNQPSIVEFDLDEFDDLCKTELGAE
ncbi:hypothetical protein EC973_001234 [Apophysomyces ossiformis]|uniref:Uncharacterized protein n=1 Tax=Apophysomyces ossiformis TaxID=679940 RepID=A0A8H7BJU9_9FUNG|nr:hypothetical protein EC973_001234 [Apophysomyces ossiformis]